MNDFYYYREGGGVTFRNNSEELHSFRDFDLVLKSVEVTEPEPQTNFIEIPFRNGSLDLTAPYGEENITFRDRFLYLTFTDIKYKENYRLRFSEFARHILGKRKEIILDKDPAYYYVGRCISLDDPEEEGEFYTAVATFEIEPYRYANCSAESPWLWDPFCFIDGMAIDTGSYIVNGVLTKIIYTGINDAIPEITVDSEMTVEFEGKEYTLNQGVNKNYDIRLRGNAKNVLIFKGNGSVKIDYKGGRF